MRPMETTAEGLCSLADEIHIEQGSIGEPTVKIKFLKM